jgi:hypothetical protein
MGRLFKYNFKRNERMKFGVHSILFTPSFLEKDLYLLEKCKAMGFDTLEVPPFDTRVCRFSKKHTREPTLEMAVRLASIRLGGDV